MYICRASYRIKSDYILIVLRLLIMDWGGGIPSNKVRERTPCCSKKCENSENALLAHINVRKWFLTSIQVEAYHTLIVAYWICFSKKFKYFIIMREDHNMQAVGLLREEAVRMRRKINLNGLYFCGCRVPYLYHQQRVHLGTTSGTVGLQGQDGQPAPPIQAVASGGT